MKSWINHWVRLCHHQFRSESIWRNVIASNETITEEPSLLQKLQKHIRPVNFLYRKQVANEELVMRYKTKWEERLNIELDYNEYEKVTKGIPRITICTKLRSFQWRLLLHATITNVHLLRYRIRDDECCTFCNKNAETVQHLLCECEKVTPIWEFICTHLRIPTPSVKQILFNQVKKNLKDKENCVILLTKYYIYCRRCAQEQPNVNSLRKFINNYINIERCIAINKQKIGQHEQKWKEFTL